MSEVLFRGKRTDNGEWVEGLLYKTSEHTYIGYTGNFDDCDLFYSPETIFVEVIPESVGQFTLLYGNYGKMIYEGDIVKADDYIFEVKFGKCGGVANVEDYGYMGFYLEPYSESTKLSAKYGLRNDICYFIDIEVIGNIYDSPELLKGAKNNG